MKHINEQELSALIDNELPENRAVACQAHLTGCEACRERLSGLQRISGLVRSLPRVRLDLDTAWATFQKRSAAPVVVAFRPRHRHMPRPLLAVAAMLCLLIGALLFTALDRSAAPEPLKENCLVEQETDAVINGYQEIAKLYKKHR